MFRPETHVALNQVICMKIDDITAFTCLYFYSLVISITLIEMGQQTFHFINVCIFKHVCIPESVSVSVKIGSKEDPMQKGNVRPRTNIYMARCMAFAINYRKTIKFAINQMESGNCRLMWNACKATTQTKATMQHNSTTKPNETFFIT